MFVAADPPPPTAMTDRCVLCLDADTFFLAVHRRADPTLDDSRPLVLHQHHDIICANSAAKLLGVVKHMRPSIARGLIGTRGQIIHAYYRDWPGPRVWIEPYQEASRSMFAVSVQPIPGNRCGDGGWTAHTPRAHTTLTLNC